MNISETMWHGFKAISLESTEIRVVMVPQLGAKIVSMFDKISQYEWLVPPVRPVKELSYGATFVKQDMSGWDEMMPTINACEFNGTFLPDHGEVWSIPWDIESLENQVTLTTSGIALPYRITRKAILSAENCLALQYEIENRSAKAIPYLYAAHPQFLADAQTRIKFPSQVTKVLNIIENDPVWGAVESPVDWPKAVSADGTVWQLDRVRGVEHRACRKFYIMPDQPIDWAALHHEGLGCQLKLSWSTKGLPYFGLWIDEGVHSAVPVAALEPCSGYYDGLTVAANNERVSILNAGEKKNWEIRIHFEKLL